MNRSVPLDEQETVICITPANVSKTAEVYTCMPNMLKKLRSLAQTRPDVVVIKKDYGDALFADVDRSCVKISPKRRMSEEQRIAATKRLERLREEKT